MFLTQIFNWNKKLTFLFFVVAMLFNTTACGSEKGLSVSAPSAQPSNELSNKQVKGMRIRIKVGEKEATATLNGSEAARNFVSLLPLTLTLEDYAKTEKINYLSKKLSTGGKSSGNESESGDITYYAPWGNLAIFYKSLAESGNGLIILGKIDGGKEIFNVPGSLTATIERID